MIGASLLLLAALSQSPATPPPTDAATHESAAGQETLSQGHEAEAHEPEAAGEEGVIVADLDFELLADVRSRLPALRHRRDDVYGSPSPVG